MRADEKNLPSKFHIDACSICQLDCPGCWRNVYPEQKDIIGQGYLRFKDFKKFVDNNCVTDIELSNTGEIFLNPELADIIYYAYEKGIKLSAEMGVNGNYISDEVAKAVVKCRFEQIAFSISGTDQETYSIYHKGGNLDMVIRNIMKINNWKLRYNVNDLPIMTWKFVTFGHNVHQIPEAKKMAKDLWMGFWFADNYYEGYSPIAKKDMHFVKKEQQGILTVDHLDEEFQQSIYCSQLWDEPQINWDGRLLGCRTNRMPCAADVFKMGLKKALNHPDYVYAKEMITGSASAKDGIFCTDCATYLEMKKNNNWIKV